MFLQLSSHIPFAIMVRDNLPTTSDLENEPDAIPEDDSSTEKSVKGSPRTNATTTELPSWFLENCVKTSAEIKDSVIPLEIRDSQITDASEEPSKRRTKRRNSDEKFEKIVYDALRDALADDFKKSRTNRDNQYRIGSDDAHRQRTKRNTTHFEMESVIYDALRESLDQDIETKGKKASFAEKLMFLGFPERQTEPGCAVFLQAVVEHFAQDIDADLVTITDEDFIDLSQHFAHQNKHVSNPMAFDQYMGFCFPEKQPNDVTITSASAMNLREEESRNDLEAAFRHDQERYSAVSAVLRERRRQITSRRAPRRRRGSSSSPFEDSSRKRRNRSNRERDFSFNANNVGSRGASTCKDARINGDDTNHLADFNFPFDALFHAGQIKRARCKNEDESPSTRTIIHIPSVHLFLQSLVRSREEEGSSSDQSVDYRSRSRRRRRHRSRSTSRSRSRSRIQSRSRLSRSRPLQPPLNDYGGDPFDNDSLPPPPPPPSYPPPPPPFFETNMSSTSIVNQPPLFSEPYPPYNPADYASVRYSKPPEDITNTKTEPSEGFTSPGSVLNKSFDGSTSFYPETNVFPPPPTQPVSTTSPARDPDKESECFDSCSSSIAHQPEQEDLADSNLAGTQFSTHAENIENESDSGSVVSTTSSYMTAPAYHYESGSSEDGAEARDASVSSGDVKDASESRVVDTTTEESMMPYAHGDFGNGYSADSLARPDKISSPFSSFGALRPIPPLSSTDIGTFATSVDGVTRASLYPKVAFDTGANPYNFNSPYAGTHPYASAYPHSGSLYADANPYANPITDDNPYPRYRTRSSPGLSDAYRNPTASSVGKARDRLPAHKNRARTRGEYLSIAFERLFKAVFSQSEPKNVILIISSGRAVLREVSDIEGLVDPICVVPLRNKLQRKLLNDDAHHNYEHRNTRALGRYMRENVAQFRNHKLLEPFAVWPSVKDFPGCRRMRQTLLPKKLIRRLGRSLVTKSPDELNERILVQFIHETLYPEDIAKRRKAILGQWASPVPDSERPRSRDSGFATSDDHKTAESNEDVEEKEDLPEDNRWSGFSPRVRSVVQRIERDSRRFQWEASFIDSLIDPESVKERWADIDLESDVKDTITRIMHQVIARKSAYGILRTNRIGGVLLYGPPGTGKTLLARVLARESGAVTICVSAAEIESKWVGESEKAVKGLFNLGQMLSPSIIFIDEADSMFGQRQHDANHQRGRVNQFLTALDGLVKCETPPFVLIASNLPQQIDPAVLRRIPSRLYMRLPAFDGRQRLFKLFLRGEQISPDVNFHDLAQYTKAFSPSDILALCVQAALICEADTTYSEDNNIRVLEMNHFTTALKSSAPTVSRIVMSHIRGFAKQFDPVGWTKMQTDEINTTIDSVRVLVANSLLTLSP
ncbi:AAA-domain-containing protein [Pyrenochaeta sp. DS3sAY3a]|nr:AAA-domain-containing protein [Pyrenochaeta sp. DS3sAY3a]